MVLLLATRRTKPAFTPFTLIEFVDQLEAGLYHRQDHQLGDALAGLHGEAVVATVPDRDHQLTLVVGVDEAHCYTIKNCLNFLTT